MIQAMDNPFSSSPWPPSLLDETLVSMEMEMDVDMDIPLDLFHSIMQEPRDLAASSLVEDVLPAISPVSLPVYPAASPEQHLQEADRGLEEAENEGQHEEELVGQTTESSQSELSSQTTELSVDMEERFRNDGASHCLPSLDPGLQVPNFGEQANVFADRSCASNISEHERWDLKSSGSTTLPQQTEDQPGDKVLVDLTDTDSDCEGEFYGNCGEVKGKRKHPSWEESGQRVEGERPEVSSNLSLIDYWPAGVPRRGVDLDATSISTFVAQDRRSIGTLGASVSAKSDSTYEMLYHMNPPMDSKLRSVFPYTLAPQVGSIKDHLSGQNKELSSRGLLKVLDSAVFREESSPAEGLMSVSLLKHQKRALAWMEKKERGAECAGGILADDQGLGKTVSTIALILTTKPPVSNPCSEGLQQVTEKTLAVDLDDEDDSQIHGVKRIVQPEWTSSSNKQHQEKTVVVSRGRPSAGTLVVCPTSVLRQWAQEIKEKVTEAAGLSVLLYHGSNRIKDPYELAKYDIVLTTYSIVSMEVPKQPLTDEKEAEERNPAQYGLIGLVSSEKKQKTAEGVKKKKLKDKKGDSETVDDSDSGPLAKVAWFRVVLDEAQNIKNRRTQVARACWGLRAKRRWCLSGTPIQNAIDDLYSYFRFLKYDPFSAYKFFRSEIKDPIVRDPSYGYRKLQLVLQKVMLRRTKTCLIDGEPIIALPKKCVSLEQVEFSPEERAFYSNLEVQYRQRFETYAAAGTVQSNYVNILWMLLCLRQACDHPLLVKDHQSDAVQRRTMESVKTLSDHQRTILSSVLDRHGDTCSICMDAPEDAVISLCAHVFCRQCIAEKLTHDDCGSCPHPNCHTPLKSSAVYSLSALKYPDGSGADTIDEASVDKLSLATLKDVPESSSKIKAVIDTLRALPIVEGFRKEDSVKVETSPDRLDDGVSCGSADVRTEKAIVFSQWTSMLDLLEVSLKKEGFCYRRLDGTMSIQSRDRALSDFKLLPKVTVMIMSLKAASLGLNMVTASHVLLIDVWWNPTTEEQAIDRAHRIGQTRDVHVSRFTVKNTIEDRILALQDRKRQMVASAFGEDAGIDQRTRLTVDEMKYLFRM